MEPSYGLLIRRAAARLIYSSNQALINSWTLVRPPLKPRSLLTAETEETNNQNRADAFIFRIQPNKLQKKFLIFQTQITTQEKML